MLDNDSNPELEKFKVIKVDGHSYFRHPAYGLMRMSDDQPFAPGFVCSLPVPSYELDAIEARIKEVLSTPA